MTDDNTVTKPTTSTTKTVSAKVYPEKVYTITFPQFYIPSDTFHISSTSEEVAVALARGKIASKASSLIKEVTPIVSVDDLLRE